MTISIEKIPQQLRDRRQWVLWKYVNRNGEPTKVPFSPSGTPAKANDSATWSAFEDCVPQVSKYEGLGFEISAADPIVGVDLDGCREKETGEIEPWAREIIEKADSYTEVSPSGTGVKLFVRGKWPHGGKNKKFDTEGEVCEKQPGIEVYSQGRYFAVTTLRLKGPSIDVEERQEFLDWLYEAYLKPEPPAAPAVNRSQCDQSEAEIVERARKYVEKMDPAVSGQGGHNTLLTVACRLVLGFGLSEGDALGILREYNQRCLPPWSEAELKHKAEDAAGMQGPRNYLRDAKPEQWASINAPKYASPKTSPTEAPASKWIRMDELVQRHITNLRENGKTPCVPLGIRKLDQALGGGVRYGDLVVVGGLSSHMKSGWVQQIGHNVTREQKMPFAFLSLEMSPDALAERTIQYASDCPKEHWHHSTQRIEEDSKKHFSDAAPFIVVEVGSTLEEVEAEIVKLFETGTRIVAVDYAQMILTGGRDDPNISMRKVAGAMKRLAKGNDGIIILLAQLRKTVEDRKPLVPRLTDLEYGPRLGQDSDVCLFVVWPHKVDPSNPPHEYQIFLEKQRQGTSKVAFTCRFEPSRLRITEAAPEYDPDDDGFPEDRPELAYFQNGFSDQEGNYAG